MSERVGEGFTIMNKSAAFASLFLSFASSYFAGAFKYEVVHRKFDEVS